MDANIAAKWVLREEFADQARALYRDTLRAGRRIIAPPLLPIEVTNVLWQQVRRALLTRDEALELLVRFEEFPIELHDPPTLHSQALILADEYGLSAVYDAHYLALAQRFGCDFWTDDRRLINTLAGRLPFVRWIGDYPA